MERCTRGPSQGLFLRDLYVLRRELFPFAIRVCMNPLLFLFVFTYVLPHMSGGGGGMNPAAQMAGFGWGVWHGAAAGLDGGGDHVLGHRRGGAAAGAGVWHHARDRRPGDVSAAGVGGGSREDRLFGHAEHDCRVYCVSAGVLHPVRAGRGARKSSWPFLILVLVLASLVAGALGLTIGTSVKPQQIGLIFGVVVVPITFLGCVYYPWAALKPIPWLQFGVLINPIVYMSEGLRAGLTPSAHMPEWLILAMLCFFLVLLSWRGMKGFYRRVVG